MGNGAALKRQCSRPSSTLPGIQGPFRGRSLVTRGHTRLIDAEPPNRRGLSTHFSFRKLTLASRQTRLRLFQRYYTVHICSEVLASALSPAHMALRTLVSSLTLRTRKPAPYEAVRL